jgi:hypothetical protein
MFTSIKLKLGITLTYHIFSPFLFLPICTQSYLLPLQTCCLFHFSHIFLTLFFCVNFFFLFKFSSSFCLYNLQAQFDRFAIVSHFLNFCFWFYCFVEVFNAVTFFLSIIFNVLMILFIYSL